MQPMVAQTLMMGTLSNYLGCNPLYICLRRNFIEQSKYLLVTGAYLLLSKHGWGCTMCIISHNAVKFINKALVNHVPFY